MHLHLCRKSEDDQAAGEGLHTLTLTKYIYWLAYIFILLHFYCIKLIDNK